MDAGDHAAVADAPPDFLIVEGTVSSVGATRGRIYLNLGKMRTADLAIVIVGRDIPAFEAQGIELRRLAGRRVRARGLIDRRFGPRMEIGSPDALEILGADTSVGRASEAGRQ